MNLSENFREKLLMFFKEHISYLLPDTMFFNKLYLKIIYKLYFNKNLDFNNPKTYTEKIQYLKLYNRQKLYQTLQDKYLVRTYLKDKIGEKYLVPLLGVWENANDIDYDSLPNQFVLKCNHDSGSYVICKDKNKLDIKSLNKLLNKSLKTDYWKYEREPVYIINNHKILAEKYIYENHDEALHLDYNFYCFNGKVYNFSQTIDRAYEELEKLAWFDRDKNYIYIPEAEGYLSEQREVLTDKIDEMIELSEKLSKGMPHVRIDFLVCNDKIYFSEFTFFNMGGFLDIPDRCNKIWGDLIDLSLIDKNNNI